MRKSSDRPFFKYLADLTCCESHTTPLVSVSFMKLERLHEYLLTAGVILLGLLFSLYAGQQIGRGQAKVVVLIAVFALALVAFRFGRKLWVLIPLAASSYGFLLGLPLSLPLRSMV